MPIEIHPERTVELTTLDKDERSRLRSIVGWILLAVVIAAPLLYAAQAHAETLKFENRYGSVRLLDKPCELDVEGKADLKAARGVFMQVLQTPQGRIPVGQIAMPGCWKRAADGYETIWEDGEKVKYPFGEFHPEGV